MIFGLRLAFCLPFILTVLIACSSEDGGQDSTRNDSTSRELQVPVEVDAPDNEPDLPVLELPSTRVPWVLETPFSVWEEGSEIVFVIAKASPDDIPSQPVTPSAPEFELTSSGILITSIVPLDSYGTRYSISARILSSASEVECVDIRFDDDSDDVYKLGAIRPLNSQLHYFTVRDRSADGNVLPEWPVDVEINQRVVATYISNKCGVVAIERVPPGSRIIVQLEAN